jgi:hypothetical protein
MSVSDNEVIVSTDLTITMLVDDAGPGGIELLWNADVEINVPQVCGATTPLLIRRHEPGLEILSSFPDSFPRYGPTRWVEIHSELADGSLLAVLDGPGDIEIGRPFSETGLPVTATVFATPGDRLTFLFSGWLGITQRNQLLSEGTPLSVAINGPLWDVRFAPISCPEIDSLLTDVEALRARIAALEASDASHTSEIATMKSDLAALEARIAEIEAIPSIRNKLGN